MTHGVGTVPDEGAGADQTIEFTTFMRGRSVLCRWSEGQVTGDAELLRRMERMGLGSEWRRSPSSVARAIASAVAHPVTIRVVEPTREDHAAAGRPLSTQRCERSSEVERCTGDGVLGDYWLG